jgi:hypothetical protein
MADRCLGPNVGHAGPPVPTDKTSPDANAVGLFIATIAPGAIAKPRRDAVLSLHPTLIGSVAASPPGRRSIAVASSAPSSNASRTAA